MRIDGGLSRSLINKRPKKKLSVARSTCQEMLESLLLDKGTWGTLQAWKVAHQVIDRIIIFIQLTGSIINLSWMTKWLIFFKLLTTREEFFLGVLRDIFVGQLMMKIKWNKRAWKEKARKTESQGTEDARKTDAEEQEPENV
jgi:hypothetical protein